MVIAEVVLIGIVSGTIVTFTRYILWPLDLRQLAVTPKMQMTMDKATQKSIEWQKANNPMAIGGGPELADMVDIFNINPAFVAGYKEAEKVLVPLINRLCEAILFDWDNKVELAWEIQSKIKEETK